MPIKCSFKNTPFHRNSDPFNGGQQSPTQYRVYIERRGGKAVIRKRKRIEEY